MSESDPDHRTALKLEKLDARIEELESQNAELQDLADAVLAEVKRREED